MLIDCFWRPRRQHTSLSLEVQHKSSIEQWRRDLWRKRKEKFSQSREIKIQHEHSEEVIEQEKHKIQKRSIVVEWKKKKKKWRRRRTIDSERQSERSRRKKKKTTTKEKRLFCCFIYFCMRQCPRRASVSSYATLFYLWPSEVCVWRVEGKNTFEPLSDAGYFRGPFKRMASAKFSRRGIAAAPKCSFTINTEFTAIVW